MKKKASPQQTVKVTVEVVTTMSADDVKDFLEAIGATFTVHVQT